MENNQMSKLVKEIIFNDEQRAGYNLNKIIFEGGYTAQEKSPLERQSNFTENKVALFRITHPSKGTGKFDWIIFVANMNDSPIPGGKPVLSNVNPEAKNLMMREYILITQNALNNAVASAPFVFSEKEEKGVQSRYEGICELAEEYSRFIVSNAQSLYDDSMQLHTGEKDGAGSDSEKKDSE